MRSSLVAVQNRFAGVLVALAVGLAVGGVPAISAAVSFDLNVEFDTGLVGSYAHVTIEEDAGALDFSIELDPSLGAQADLHEFYFNLVGAFTGLAITSSDAVPRAYRLIEDPSVAGGAGAGFDYGVSFGNGAGWRGNWVLSAASFRLSADQPLSIEALFESSLSAGGTIESQFAAHVQGTALLPGSDSETVGGIVPEPATGSLLALGIVALASRRRRFPS
jgi:hypothetical protein